MKIAITGGTGFLGRNVARMLSVEGHELVLIARGIDHIDAGVRQLPRTRLAHIGLDNSDQLAQAFAECQAVVHCAGINREIGKQTFYRVHVVGTEHVVRAAKSAGVKKLVLISFLRARPNCGSAYHESKWAAEELVRHSGLDYTILKCGVICGQGDHMLNHLSHAFFSFPLFAFVGSSDKPVRPNAVEDVARVVIESVLRGALSRETVAVLGPEQLGLREAVRRVASVVGKRPVMFPLPVWCHYVLGWLAERAMVIPLVSVAQVRMLSEGLAEPAPACEILQGELAPQKPFTTDQIRQGLPPAGGFSWKNLRCCHRRRTASGVHKTKVFFEMP